MEQLKLYITDTGDMSVGIFPVTWTIECPFDKTIDDESRKFFRKEMKKTYSDFCEGGIELRFEDEDDSDFEY